MARQNLLSFIAQNIRSQFAVNLCFLLPFIHTKSVGWLFGVCSCPPFPMSPFLIKSLYYLPSLTVPGPPSIYKWPLGRSPIICSICPVPPRHFIMYSRNFNPPLSSFRYTCPAVFYISLNLGCRWNNQSIAFSHEFQRNISLLPQVSASSVRQVCCYIEIKILVVRKSTFLTIFFTLIYSLWKAREDCPAFTAI